MQFSTWGIKLHKYGAAFLSVCSLFFFQCVVGFMHINATFVNVNMVSGCESGEPGATGVTNTPSPQSYEHRCTHCVLLLQELVATPAGGQTPHPNVRARRWSPLRHLRTSDGGLAGLLWTCSRWFVLIIYFSPGASLTSPPPPPTQTSLPGAALRRRLLSAKQQQLVVRPTVRKVVMMRRRKGGVQ